MKLFQIMIPARDNDGRPYTSAIRLFENVTAQLAGGFTRLASCDGFWLDHKTGKQYRDTMIPYHIACTAGLFLALREKAFKLFPDQSAIMTADLGTAEIVYRHEPVKISETIVA